MDTTNLNPGREGGGIYPHMHGKPETELDWFQALMSLARYLRTPEGCPWDREQTSANFAKYLGDEVVELQDALASGDNKHSEEEMGDVLFSLLATIAAAEEEGRMTLESILTRAHEKMIRRHEHVFGDATAETPKDAIRVWEEVKRKEREGR